MYFFHAPEIWQEFPRLTPGVVVVDNIHVEVNVAERLPPLYELARKRLAQATESEMPEIAAWRRVYSQMGLKPTKYRSAAEALLRRFKREDDLPRIHPLVDLCNGLSLAFALPVAVFDLAQVVDYLVVRQATGSEQYLAFNGQIEQPEPEEVIFADGADQVHARRWTFRQSLRSVVTEETKQVLIVSEAQHENGPTDIRRLLDRLVEHITELWGPPQAQAILTAETPRLEINTNNYPMTKINPGLVQQFKQKPEHTFDLIVRTEGQAASHMEWLTSAGFRVKQKFRLTSAVAGSCSGRAALKLLDQSWVVSVEPDTPMQAMGD